MGLHQVGAALACFSVVYKSSARNADYSVFPGVPVSGGSFAVPAVFCLYMVHIFKVGKSLETVGRLKYNAAAASSVFVNADSASEAVEALIALGYSSTEARNAVSQVRDKADTPEELIRLALRAMAGM